ncbi:MAG TPA: DUF2878 domain-containing protein [Elusimicrobiota bacterium]|jgi:hypothetical protein|nr:DUF2878 domain-containing protein [Elusimicrobiota bacterium]
MSYRVVNYALFQAGWFACVWAGAHGRAGVGPAAVAAIALVHLAMIADKKAELLLVAAAVLLGPWVDFALVRAGALSYPNAVGPAWPAPDWIIALWALLAMTARHCLGWLRGRYGAAAVLGALGGPLSYAAGARMGALRFGSGTWPILEMGLAWGLAMPGIFLLAEATGG